MKIASVILGYEEYEWIREPAIEGFDDHDGLKSIIRHDDQFEAYVNNVGVEVALEKVTRFHRVVANQLIERGIKDLVGDWVVRTVALTQTLKRRRQELRRWYAVHHGEAAAVAEAERLDVLYPRAQWASKLDGRANR